MQTTNGCDSVFLTALMLNDLPNTNIEEFEVDTICIRNGSLSLPNATPSGGTYSGNGINDTGFYPDSAGLGTHLIIYSYTDSNSCFASDTTSLTVLSCVGIGKQFDKEDILIYPNPTNGMVKVELPVISNSDINFRILDKNSRMIYNSTARSGSSFYVDFSQYSQGMYYLQFEIQGIDYSLRIIKH